MLQDLNEISDGKYTASTTWCGQPATIVRAAILAVREWGTASYSIRTMSGVCVREQGKALRNCLPQSWNLV